MNIIQCILLLIAPGCCSGGTQLLAENVIAFRRVIFFFYSFRDTKLSIQKTGLLLGALALGVFSPDTSTFAADLPVKAKIAPVPYYDWSGVYVGVHAGYGGGMKDWSF